MPKTLQKNQLSSFISGNDLPERMIVPAETQQTLLVEHITNSKIILEKGSKLTLVLFATEGWESMKKVEFEFEGQESEVQFLGFILGTDKHTFALETFSNHKVPHTKAHYFLKAALFDSSVVDYKGNIVIDKKGQMADTYMAHHTLLLSKTARARTIPALEIEADEVKAGHAATLGKVDDEMMFYLQSRGITSKEAQELLILGFFEDLLQKISDISLQGKVREKIFEKLALKLDLPFSSFSS